VTTDTEDKSGQDKVAVAADSEIGDSQESKEAGRSDVDNNNDKHQVRSKGSKASKKRSGSVKDEKSMTKKSTTRQKGHDTSEGVEQAEMKKGATARLTSEKWHAQEHQDLPKLKAWTMMGRFFQRLHASVIAFQGGSPEEVALIAQAPAEDEPSTGQIFSSLLLWCILSALVAYFYSNRKEKPGSVDSEKRNEGVEVFQEWKYGLFSCLEDSEITLCSLCCPAIRWAMTLSYVPGMLSFWVAFFIYVCVELLGGLTAGTIGWICLALLCTAYRQELRQKFNMEQQGGMTYVTDAMTYFCCTCCAIAQEARQVEDALRSGHPALQESEEKSEAGQ